MAQPSISSIRTNINNFSLNHLFVGAIKVNVGGYATTQLLQAAVDTATVKILGDNGTTVIFVIDPINITVTANNTIIINNINFPVQIPKIVQDLLERPLIYFSFTFRTQNYPILFKLYIKRAITINDVSKFVMYPISKFTTENGNRFNIFGTGFNVNCGVRIYKSNDVFYDYYPSPTDTTNKVTIDNNEKISMDLDLNTIFPDNYARVFRIRIIEKNHQDQVLNDASPSLNIDVIPIVTGNDVVPYYNLPTNKIIIKGIGFTAFDFDNGNLFSGVTAVPSLHVSDAINPGNDYSSSFTLDSNTNTEAIFSFTALVPPQDIDPNLEQIGQIKAKCAIVHPLLHDLYEDELETVSSYNFSNLAIIQLFKAISKYTDGVINSIQDVNFSLKAYMYASTAYAAVSEYVDNHKTLNNEFSNFTPNLLAASNLVPIMYALLNSTISHPIVINGISSTTNNLFLYYLSLRTGIDTVGDTFHDIDLAVIDIAGLLEPLLRAVFTASGLTLGYITAHQLSIHIAYFVYQGFNPRPVTTIEIKTPVYAQIRQAEYIASEKETPFDYLFEFESGEITFPLSLMRDTFKYQNSNHGLVFTVDQTKINLFKYKLDLIFKNANFRLVNSRGSYNGSKIISPVGSIADHFIWKLRSYLLGSPNIGGPIKNETEIKNSINAGLQNTGALIPFGTQIVEYLFSIDEFGQPSNDVIAMFNHLASNVPERFNPNASGNDLLLPIPFPFMGGDVLSFVSLIGGPIAPTHGVFVNVNNNFGNNQLTMKDIFPLKCAPSANAPAIEYLLDSTGKIIRPTHDMFKILLFDDTV